MQIPGLSSGRRQPGYRTDGSLSLIHIFKAVNELPKLKFSCHFGYGSLWDSGDLGKLWCIYPRMEDYFFQRVHFSGQQADTGNIFLMVSVI